MTQATLLQKKCIPCEGGTLPLTRDQAQKFLKQLPGWKLSDDFSRISKIFSFLKYMDGVLFATNVAERAEEENHHPDIKIGYKKVMVTFTTHAIHGLSENDFIMAAKINQLTSK